MLSRSHRRFEDNIIGPTHLTKVLHIQDPDESRTNFLARIEGQFEGENQTVIVISIQEIQWCRRNCYTK